MARRGAGRAGRRRRWAAQWVGRGGARTSRKLHTVWCQRSRSIHSGRSVKPISQKRRPSWARGGARGAEGAEGAEGAGGAEGGRGCGGCRGAEGGRGCRGSRGAGGPHLEQVVPSQAAEVEEAARDALDRHGQALHPHQLVLVRLRTRGARPGLGMQGVCRAGAAGGRRRHAPCRRARCRRSAGPPAPAPTPRRRPARRGRGVRGERRCMRALGRPPRPGPASHLLARRPLHRGLLLGHRDQVGAAKGARPALVRAWARRRAGLARAGRGVGERTASRACRPSACGCSRARAPP